MPDNKRQHFVPKFILRGFSPDDRHRSIHLINVANKKLIKNASIQSQCYRDYLYGRDGRLEYSISELEGRWAALLRKLEARDSIFQDLESTLLIRLLLVIQRGRTTYALTQAQMMQDGMLEMIRKMHPGKSVPSGIDFEMTLPLGTAVKAVPLIFDLKLCAIMNETNQEFIVGDNPCVAVNRFWKEICQRASIGYASAGLTLLMPLTPTISILAYDGNVYSVPEKESGYLKLKRDSDVAKLNGVQVAGCLRNVYFRDVACADPTMRLVEAQDAFKRAARPTIRGFYETSKDVFTPVSRVPEREGRRSGMVMTSAVQPEADLAWAFLKYRDKPKFHHNGSAVGAVRDLPWTRIFTDYNKDGGGPPAPSRFLRFAAGHPLLAAVGPWKRPYFS